MSAFTARGSVTKKRPTTAEAIGKCNRQVGGQTLFAEVKLRVMPLHEDKPARVSTNWYVGRFGEESMRFKRC